MEGSRWTQGVYEFLLTVSVIALTCIAVGCGGTPTETPQPTPPPAPSYPSTPPVPLTWSPSSLSLPAPPACAPPTSTCTPPDPEGSSDFPLTVSSPTDFVDDPGAVVAFHGRKSGEIQHFGPNPYANELYFNALAGGNNVSHFSYDLYLYIDNPDAPQALEFDVNQTFSGYRWTWGSECNFKGETPPFWDIWDDANHVWRETSVPGNPFPANTWIHLIWTLERVGNQVHYISLEVGNQTYNVDTYYTNQADWTVEEIDTAFQMDLAQPPQPYNGWLDQVNLTAY